MNSFSTRLKHALDTKNVTPTELSKKTGIAKSSISDWLSGKYEAKQDKVFQIAQSLEIDEGWLLGLDVPMEKTADLMTIYNELDKKRQSKVYRFAEHQLELQNSTDNNESFDDDFLLAAHIDDNVTEEEMKEIKDFIQKVKDEHRNS